MRLITIKSKVLTILFLSFCFASFANSSDKVDKADEKFNPKEMILHHVKDAYGMHIATLNANEDHPIHISIPLPVIVYTEKGFTVFFIFCFSTRLPWSRNCRKKWPALYQSS
jgi:F-type H+-transporting ATPase subunit a